MPIHRSRLRTWPWMRCSPAGKIAGAAQRRLASGGVLHHVTMAYDIDAAKMTEVLRFGREPLPGPGTRSGRQRVEPLRRQTRLSPASRSSTGWSPHSGNGTVSVDDELRTDELRAAEKLVATKYGTSNWTTRLP